MLLSISLPISAEDYNLKIAQTILKQKGFNPGVVDGYPGKKTSNAIYDYQKKHNLKVTSKLNTKTWQHLTKKEMPPKPIIVNDTKLNPPSLKPMISVEERLFKLEEILKSLQQPVSSVSHEMLKETSPITKISSSGQSTGVINSNLKAYKPKRTDKKIVLGVIAKRGKDNALKKWDY
jgi:peptidoglycan hydrolase-like protein with peptidoglycan-binding domain